jgi:hypothetical protein
VETGGDPAITARPIAVNTGSRTGTRRLIGPDETMVIYVGKRPLRAWPSETGSDSELPISLTTNCGLHRRAKNVQQDNIYRRHQSGRFNRRQSASGFTERDILIVKLGHPTSTDSGMLR